MRNILILGGIVLLLFIGGVWWSTSIQSNDPNIVSRSGLHWHPELAVFVNGEKQEISANIGLPAGMSAAHNPIHTHDSSGVIHLEFQGIVRKDDLTLGRFFRVWGKDFMGFGSSVTMTVNGEENAEFQNYMMKDGDKIELRYQ